MMSSRTDILSNNSWIYYSADDIGITACCKEEQDKKKKRKEKKTIEAGQNRPRH